MRKLRLGPFSPMQTHRGRSPGPQPPARSLYSFSWRCDRAWSLQGPGPAVCGAWLILPCTPAGPPFPHLASVCPPVQGAQGHSAFLPGTPSGSVSQSPAPPQASAPPPRGCVRGQVWTPGLSWRGRDMWRERGSPAQAEEGPAGVPEPHGRLREHWHLGAARGGGGEGCGCPGIGGGRVLGVRVSCGCRHQ